MVTLGKYKTDNTLSCQHLLDAKAPEYALGRAKSRPFGCALGWVQMFDCLIKRAGERPYGIVRRCDLRIGNFGVFGHWPSFDEFVRAHSAKFTTAGA